LALAGNPFCQVELDRSHGVVTLVTEPQTPEPDVTRFKNVSFVGDSLRVPGSAELIVQVKDNLHGVFALVLTIADELQKHRVPLAAAVATGISTHLNVFANRTAMSAEKQVGLFGELLLLEHLIGQIGAGPAVSSWQGSKPREHDFVFEALHLEVKTTTGERRKHMIHGLTQLVPVPGAGLAVISVQLTQSTLEAGTTLPELVNRIRSLTGGHIVDLNRLLESATWYDDDADLYPTPWELRSVPRAYRVTDDFPAITAASLDQVPNIGLISDISYRIDLTDRTPDELSEPIAGFIATKGAPNS